MIAIKKSKSREVLLLPCCNAGLAFDVARFDAASNSAMDTFVRFVTGPASLVSVKSWNAVCTLDFMTTFYITLAKLNMAFFESARV